ncbi:hypothetical protein BDZ91DRAFT_712142 [Kalaharituber pfeilii]|nr:hypothetical protein BDZ91DRAFT_712142 [Kalaharituber pfeilii]
MTRSLSAQLALYVSVQCTFPSSNCELDFLYTHPALCYIAIMASIFPIIHIQDYLIACILICKLWLDELADRFGLKAGKHDNLVDTTKKHSTAHTRHSYF